MNRLLLIFTAVGIFGLVPFYGTAAPLCGQVFGEKSVKVPNYSKAISQQLIVLKDNLNELRKSLKDNKHDANRLEAIGELDTDPRESAYVLQGAYRLLLSHPSSAETFSPSELKSLEQGLKAMKTLEKTLGGYQVQVDLYATAKKMEMPEAFLRYLKRNRNEASEQVLLELKKSEYLDKNIPAISKHLERLEQGQTRIGKKSDFLSESLSAEISRVREKVDTEMKPLILKKVYTHNELEEGAHAFRRSLRWLKVYILAYPKYFATRVNPEEFAHLDGMIAELRKIKKPGEMREKMIEALKSFGSWNGILLREGDAEKIVAGMMLKKFDDIELKTQSILKDYEARDGLTHLLMGQP